MGFFYKFEFVRNISVELNQCGIPKAVPCRSSHQTAEARLHNQDIAVDVRSIIQSTSIRLFTYSYVIFHLCDYWDAGKIFCVTILT